MASSNLASGGYCSHMTEFHSDQQMPQSRLVDSAPSTASSVDENNVFPYISSTIAAFSNATIVNPEADWTSVPVLCFRCGVRNKQHGFLTIA